jgi:ketol-acid reductoisomerase
MTKRISNSADSRNKLMKEALELQSEWERTLKRITNGREFEDLTPEEQNEWKRVSTLFNEQIDSKLREWERS